MKHLRELPAVVVIFFELDWTDPDWNEKKLECAGKVRPTRKFFVERVLIILFWNWFLGRITANSLGQPRNQTGRSACPERAFPSCWPRGHHGLGAGFQPLLCVWTLSEIAVRPSRGYAQPTGLYRQARKRLLRTSPKLLSPRNKGYQGSQVSSTTYIKIWNHMFLMKCFRNRDHIALSKQEETREPYISAFS